MHKEFHLAAHCRAYFAHLLKRKPAFEYDAPAAEGIELTRPLYRADGALRRSMHGHLDVGKLQQPLLAEYKSIHAGVLGLQHHGVHIVPFSVVD